MAALRSLFATQSKQRAKSILLQAINSGGLQLLNEMIIDNAGHQIATTLKLVASSNHFPIALYCTAGSVNLSVALTC